MHYVYRRHKETKREYMRIDIYLDNLKRYRFKKGQKGLQRCIPNEHLDRKDNNFPTSSSEDQSLSTTQISRRYSEFKKASSFLYALILFT